MFSWLEDLLIFSATLSIWSAMYLSSSDVGFTLKNILDLNSYVNRNLNDKPSLRYVEN